MTLIGEDRQVKYKMVPSMAMEIHKIRSKYFCKEYDESGILQVHFPPSSIEKSKAEPSFHPHVMVKKNNDQLPLHRLMGNFERHGLENDDGIHCAGGGKCAKHLARILKEIGKQIMSGDLNYTDDTPITVLESRVPRGSKKAFPWARVCGLLNFRASVLQEEVWPSSHEDLPASRNSPWGSSADRMGRVPQSKA